MIEVIATLAGGVLGWFLKYVVVNGIIGHWLAERTIKYVIKPVVDASPRKSGMLLHAVERVMGRGHVAGDPSRCAESSCRTIFA